LPQITSQPIIRGKKIANLDDMPFPSWDLFPISEYASNFHFTGATSEDRTMSVLTSRGCVNQCSFCQRIESGLRVRSIDNVFDELEVLNKQYGINYFMFEDEMFVPHMQRLKSFSDSLHRLEGDIKYWCSARVDLAKDREVLKLLKESGCQLLSFGLESLDQNVLDLMRKNTQVEDNYRAVENTLRAGIHPGLNFIWGNLGDSLESLDKIVHFLINYDSLGQLRTVRPVTPYPGSLLYSQAISQGKLEGPGDFFKRFTNSDRITVNFLDIPEVEAYNALLEANSVLVRNYYQKKGNPESSQPVIDAFRRLYFPTCPEDLKFRGVRHYEKPLKQ